MTSSLRIYPCVRVCVQRARACVCVCFDKLIAFSFMRFHAEGEIDRTNEGENNRREKLGRKKNENVRDGKCFTSEWKNRRIAGSYITFFSLLQELFRLLARMFFFERITSRCSPCTELLINKCIKQERTSA